MESQDRNKNFYFGYYFLHNLTKYRKNDRIIYIKKQQSHNKNLIW